MLLKIVPSVFFISFHRERPCREESASMKALEFVTSGSGRMFFVGNDKQKNNTDVKRYPHTCSIQLEGSHSEVIAPYPPTKNF